MGMEAGRTLARRRHLVEGLNRLVEMNRALVILYDTVLARIEDPGLRRDLEHFRGEHMRHAHDLGHAVRRLGGVPAWPGPVAPGHVGETPQAPALAVVGGRPLLELLDPSEEMIRRACEAVLRVEEVHAHPDVEAMVERSLDHERHHEAWLRGVLTAL